MKSKVKKVLTVFLLCNILVSHLLAVTPDLQVFAKTTSKDTSKDSTSSSNKKSDSNPDKSTTTIPGNGTDPVTTIQNIYYQISLELPLAWSAVAGLRCYNNEMPVADYRMDSELFQKILSKFNITVNNESVAVIENLFVENDRRTFSEIVDNTIQEPSKEFAWLVKNNIISDTENVPLFDSRATYSRTHINQNGQFTASDLWMALYKINWGVIPSRLIFYTDSPKRNGVPVEKIEGYSCTNGTVNAKFADDWSVYVFPNVYELYLTELLNMGLIDINKISSNRIGGKSFLAGYTKLLQGADVVESQTSAPAWATALEPMKYNKKSKSGFKTGAYGATWIFDDGVIKRQPRYPVAYFKTEDITVMSALEIIRTYLEATEDYITDTEASIINYKYGISYLGQADNDRDKSTLALMIAKGILNFEDSTEFDNLYSKLTNEFAYKLLYRVANKDARFDFSSIQLTDSQSFWQQKGFQETDISVDPNLTDVVEINWNNVDVELLESPVIIGSASTIMVASNTGNNNNGGSAGTGAGPIQGAFVTPTPTPTVSTSEPAESTLDVDDSILWQIKMHDIEGLNNYKFANHSLDFLVALKKYKGNNEKYIFNRSSVLSKDALHASDNAVKNIDFDAFNTKWKALPEEIVSVVYHKSSGAFDINFNVKAETAQEALKLVKGRLKLRKLKNSSSVLGVTQVWDSTKEKQTGNTMIPASALKKIANGFSSELVIIQNNILQNTTTDITAIMLPEQGIALVGNRVLSIKDSMIVATDNEVYYNLEIICSLLSNAHLLKLSGINYQIIASTTKGVIKEKAKPITIYETSRTTSTKLDKAYTYTHKQIYDITQAEIEEGPEPPLANFIRLSDLTNSINQVSRHFVSESGNEYDLIVDWIYTVPDDSYVDEEPIETIDSVVAAYNKAPTDTKYKEMWNTNLSLNNALGNLIYGTEDFVYFTSGWCTPKVTILSYTEMSKPVVLKEVLTDNNFLSKLTHFGFKVSGTNWLNKFNVTGSDRTLDILYGKKNGKYCHIFGGTEVDDKFYGSIYFVNASGVIYKNIVNEDRLDFTLGSNNLPTSGNCRQATVTYEEPAQNSMIKIQLVDNTLQRFYYAGVVTLGGKQYYVIQPTQNSTSATTSLSMSDLSVPSSEVTSAQLKPFLQCNANDPNKPVEDFAKRWYSALANGITRPSIVEAQKEAYIAGLSARYGEPNNNVLANLILANRGLQLYLGSGKYYNIVESNNTNVLKMIQPTNLSGNFYTPVILYLPVNSTSWKLTNNASQKYYKLVSNKWTSVLNDDYFRTGINEKIIDMLFTNYLGSVSANSISAQSTLYIGNIKFTKQSDGSFTSEPLKCTESNLNYNQKSTKKKLYKCLNGIGIRIGSQEVEFADYVTSCEVSANWKALNTGIKSLYLDKETGKLMIGVVSEDATAVKSKVYKKKAAFSEYCLNIRITDELLCRPLNAEKTMYKLLALTFSYSDGMLDTSPFYYEEIQLSNFEDIALDSTNYEFYDINNKDKLIGEFDEEMSTAKRADLRTIVLVICISLVSLILVNCWLSYFLINRGMVRGVLASFSDLFIRKDGSRGFDPIKFITIGIYNLDSKPSMFRLVISTFVLLLIIAVTGIMLIS